MMNLISTNTRKRKFLDADPSNLSVFPLDELNQDLLERVLSRLPAASFFRLRSVCKRWSSVATSATFRLACAQIPYRDPWFLMVGQDLSESTVYDSSERNWKNINHPNFLQQAQFSKSIPVASSGGLACFRTPSGQLIVCNPVTGACREVPPPSQADITEPLHAIAMNSSPNELSSYRIMLVFGELSELKIRVYDSEKNHWEDEVMLRKTSGISPEESGDAIVDDTDTVYFLSKAGDVVATNMQRSPSKQYSSVLTVKGDGEEVVYFLGHSGTIVACNVASRTYDEYPRLLPIYFEYSIDVVECNGEMLVVVLSDILETASLRVWKFSKGDRQWSQVAAMPPSMSHRFYGKKADINCVGCGHSIMICFNSSEFGSSVMCNLLENEWVELPKCYVNGRNKEFSSAFSFQPRVEASV